MMLGHHKTLIRGSRILEPIELCIILDILDFWNLTKSENLYFCLNDFALGKQLFEEVFSQVSKDKEIKYIYLHVQVGNSTALEFYKKYGFEVTETIKNYYTDIQPADCHLLRLNLKHEWGQWINNLTKLVVDLEFLEIIVVRRFIIPIKIAQTYTHISFAYPVSFESIYWLA